MDIFGPTGQLQVVNLLVYVLFDSCTTHSFASHKFTEEISHECNMLKEGFSTSLPSRKILLSSHWLQAGPVLLSGRE